MEVDPQTWQNLAKVARTNYLRKEEWVKDAATACNIFFKSVDIKYVPHFLHPLRLLVSSSRYDCRRDLWHRIAEYAASPDHTSDSVLIYGLPRERLFAASGVDSRAHSKAQRHALAAAAMSGPSSQQKVLPNNCCARPVPLEGARHPESFHAWCLEAGLTVPEQQIFTGAFQTTRMLWVLRCALLLLPLNICHVS